MAVKKIKPGMIRPNAVLELADNNPQAIPILFDISVAGIEDSLDGMEYLIVLDQLEIYGDEILDFHQMCNENPNIMKDFLRANRHGHLSAEAIKSAIREFANKPDLDSGPSDPSP